MRLAIIFMLGSSLCGSSLEQELQFFGRRDAVNGSTQITPPALDCLFIHAPREHQWPADPEPDMRKRQRYCQAVPAPGQDNRRVGSQRNRQNGQLQFTRQSDQSPFDLVIRPAWPVSGKGHQLALRQDPADGPQTMPALGSRYRSASVTATFADPRNDLAAPGTAGQNQRVSTTEQGKKRDILTVPENRRTLVPALQLCFEMFEPVDVRLPAAVQQHEDSAADHSNQGGRPGPEPHAQTLA